MSHPALHLRGIVLPEGIQRDLFVVAGRITFQPADDARTVLDGGWLVPGLVDAHAHLALASPAPEQASAAERVRASARVHLAAGVLAIREPGGPDSASREIGPDEGLPRIYTAGRFLAPRGRYFPGLARSVDDAGLPGAAEEEARASGAWAKVIGDFPGPRGRIEPNYAPAALAEAARRVHAVGGRIAIHATVPETIEAAIEAGFDTIEHGVGLQDDHIAAMAARQIVLVPTLTILPDADEWMAGLGLGPAEYRAAVDAAHRHPEMTRRAVAAGVRVLAGTDAGMGPHGMVRVEIGHMLAAGVPPALALAAGSWDARRYLGLPGIEEGAPADLVAYPADPRGDAEVLAHPALRILDGRVVA
jgi:imidazolonepropionase-like amidohydrolase